VQLEHLPVLGLEQLQRDAQRVGVVARLDTLQPARAVQGLVELAGVRQVERQHRRLAAPQVLGQEAPRGGPQVAAQREGVVEARRGFDLERAQHDLLRDVADADAAIDGARALAPQTALEHADLDPEQFLERRAIALFLPVAQELDGALGGGIAHARPGPDPAISPSVGEEALA